MGRAVVNVEGVAALDDLAGVHDVHPVGIPGHHAQVMGDDDQGDAHVPGQLLHQFQDLRLDGHVQRRGGLVGDDQFGLAAQGHGDHHPLAHAAAQMVGILAQPPVGVRNPDQVQQLQRPRPRRVVVHVQVVGQRLGKLPPDGQHGIERGHGLLEHHRDLAAPHVADLCVAQLEKIGAHETDAALHDAPRRVGNEPEDGKGADRLAAPRFADDGNRLSLLHDVGNSVYRPHRAGGGEELSVQVVDFEQRRHDSSQFFCGPRPARKT